MIKKNRILDKDKLNQKSIFSLNIALLVILIILLNVLIGYINLNVDLTSDKRHSISDSTKKILTELDDRLYLKIYLKGDFPAGFKRLQQATSNLIFIFKDIANENLDFEFIDPSLTETKEEKQNLFNELIKQDLLPTDLKLNTQGKRTSQIIFPGAIIYYKNKSIAVNFLRNNIGNSASENINISIENLEYEFITAIKRVMSESSKKIAFLEGNGELSEKSVHDITSSVFQDNFNLSSYYDVERFNIKLFDIDSTSGEADIIRKLEKLREYSAIIIAKPTISFNILEKYLIDQYIMNGGKVLWLVDGVNASMDSLQGGKKDFFAKKNKLNIDDQLFKYGVRINSDLIEDQRSTEIPIVIGYSGNLPQQSFFKWPYFPLLFSNSNHPISKGLDAIKCDFVSSIDTIKNNIKKTILIHSSRNSRKNLSPIRVSLSILENPPEKDTYNKSNIPIGVLLEGKFESVFNNRILPKKELKIKNMSPGNKMIIISDGDIIANRVSTNGTIFPLGYDRFIDFTYPGNKQFLINSIQYLCDDLNLMSLKSKELQLRLLDKNKISRYKLLIQILNISIPFVLLIIFGVLFNIKRRKYA